MRIRYIAALTAIAALFAIVAGSIQAANGGVITFLDSTPEPQYQFAGTGLVNDSGCGDIVTMVMSDATGQITDIDTFCLNLTTGLGNDFTDWGSFTTNYFPTQGPITYTMFDTALADACDLAENSQACADLLLGGTRACIARAFYQPLSLPVAVPHLGGFPASCPAPALVFPPVEPTRTSVNRGGAVAAIGAAAAAQARENRARAAAAAQPAPTVVPPRTGTGIDGAGSASGALPIALPSTGTGGLLTEDRSPTTPLLLTASALGLALTLPMLTRRE